MDIIAGISAVNTALTLARSIKDADKALDKAVLKQQMAEVIEKLVDSKVALSDAKEAIQEKDAEILQLKKAFEDRSDLVTAWEGYKYKKDQAGNTDGYPACPSCENIGKITFLVPNGSWQKGKCPTCKQTFSPIHPYNSDGEREEKERKAARQPVRVTRTRSWMS